LTEREWFRCEDATEMISFLANSGSILNGYDRKIQLFSVACVHRVADRLPNDLCRQFLEAMERSAETNVGEDDERSALALARSLGQNSAAYLVS